MTEIQWSVYQDPIFSQPNIKEKIAVWLCDTNPRHGKKWKELTDSVTHFIVKDSLPIHTVAKSAFKDIIKKFDSRYEIPSSTYFSRTAIPALYSSTKEKVATQLQAVEYFASTTDMWYSVGSKPYISYTVHFVDSKWELQSIALSIHFLPEDHTATIISEVLEEILQEWNPSSQKQVSLTTDSGANLLPNWQDLDVPDLIHVVPDPCIVWFV